ncbi:MAG: UDP-N-acetylmuramoyl-tripeptide--D-alanyl-D-alanine ligase [Oscillospiraceae bacterium]|jgi:UDP-N-acetylmuramoyl-tripeptide--D-alanyl-D-alanine ligase|nr:UDP-N-acetylmuramoyl-tripeptide--D-alanyl-D-alanine ligase [Oscillospiraceae bacterium]
MNMLPMTLGDAARAMSGRLIAGEKAAQREIVHVVSDSREAVPGALFFCFRGERVNGSDYIADAFARGAICAVTTEKDAIPESSDAMGAYILVASVEAALAALAAYYRMGLRVPVIGVVGSVGKTTAKEMTAAVLSERYSVLKTHGNLNNEIGAPLTVLKIGSGHNAAVIEMGISDFGEMTRLASVVRPDICIITAIGRCHLEKLGSLNGVLRAKSEVFPLMPENGVAILNGDDALLRKHNTGRKTVTFGTVESCDWRAENITTAATRSIAFDIISPRGERARAEIPAYGTHLVYAALSAAAVGSRLGLSLREIIDGLAKYRPVDGRANVIEAGALTIIDDCYNANPNSMAAALCSLAALKTRRTAILGDMRELGSASAAAHREIGELAGRLGIDCLICCGENAELIFKGFIGSGAEAEAYHFPFREALFEKLPELTKKGGAVLVKASHSEKFDEITARLRELWQ